MKFTEPYFTSKPRGLASRIRIVFFRMWGMRLGKRNRFEKGRVRSSYKIIIGNDNAFTAGYMLWPIEDNLDVPRIHIGSGNYFNRNLMIDACGLIVIGDNNMFGPDIYITDANHRFQPGLSSKELPMNIGRVTIGNNCWIGAKAVILKDVHLGDNCIVGAGAVVTRSFPAGSIIAGVPAKLIKQI